MWGVTEDRDMSGGRRIQQANKNDEDVMEIQTVQSRLKCGAGNGGWWWWVRGRRIGNDGVQ